ncbi:hypothetical protein [Sulfuricurvum sp.]|uniref:hypothetical protein n=1 Tax=Sulfuricurvum sp. TaxID=2025608 RepID=UPI002E32C2B1|nr:hypothetical protein [Sulfuricurvum sp.]HEX5328734.1 hypothetical protein [Sulfuricurvum sp.]
MNSRNFLFLSLLFSLLWGGECDVTRYGAAKISEFETELYRAKEEFFTITIPKGWNKREERLPYESPGIKTAGVILSAPLDDGWISPEISVIYYGNGGFFPDYRDYIRRERHSFNRRDDDAKTIVTDAVADGKKGIGFEIRTTEAVNTEPLFEPGIMYRLNGEMIPKMADVVEVFRVFPEEKGFWVFHYKASESGILKCRGVFDRVVDSARFGKEP